MNRDELQGVIAHEFSHILNGDMKLNMNLMATVNGIIFLSLAGYWLMRIGSKMRGKNNPGLALALIGLFICIIGYIGIFFGNIIKAAVSREREFLADASAVQFTRNPSGIAGALKKILNNGAGSRLASENAEESSHFYFSNGLAQAWFGLFATHPPLEERISAIEGVPVQSEEKHEVLPQHYREEQGQGAVSMLAQPIKSQEAPPFLGLKGVPEHLVKSISDPALAVGFVYAVLLDESDPATTQRQMKILEKEADPIVFKYVGPLADSVKNLSPSHRIPLLDAAMPALRSLSLGQAKSLLSLCKRLAEAGGHVSLKEYCVQKMLARHVGAAFSLTKPLKTKYTSINNVTEECFILLAAMARVGANNEAAIKAAFDAGLTVLGCHHGKAIPTESLYNIADIDSAVEKISQATAAVKKTVLSACEAAIASDGKIGAGEMELLRATSDALGCVGGRPSPLIGPSAT